MNGSEGQVRMSRLVSRVNTVPGTRHHSHDTHGVFSQHYATLYIPSVSRNTPLHSAVGWFGFENRCEVFVASSHFESRTGQYLSEQKNQPLEGENTMPRQSLMY